jgi:hypothetical protein
MMIASHKSSVTTLLYARAIIETGIAGDAAAKVGDIHKDPHHMTYFRHNTVADTQNRQLLSPDFRDPSDH